MEGKVIRHMRVRIAVENCWIASVVIAGSGDHDERTPCEVRGCAGLRGILRLRLCFASRSTTFAQDDRWLGAAKRVIGL